MRYCFCVFAIASFILPLSAVAQTTDLVRLLEHRRGQSDQDLKDNADRDRQPFIDMLQFVAEHPTKDVVSVFQLYLQDSDAAVRTGAELLLRMAAVKWPPSVLQELEGSTLVAWQKAFSPNETESLLHILAGVARSGSLQPESCELVVKTIVDGSEEASFVAMNAAAEIHSLALSARAMSAVFDRFPGTTRADLRRLFIEYVAQRSVNDSGRADELLAEAVNDPWEMNRQIAVAALAPRAQRNVSLRNILIEKLRTETDETTKGLIRGALEGEKK